MIVHSTFICIKDINIIQGYVNTKRNKYDKNLSFNSIRYLENLLI